MSAAKKPSAPAPAKPFFPRPATRPPTPAQMGKAMNSKTTKPKG